MAFYPMMNRGFQLFRSELKNHSAIQNSLVSKFVKKTQLEIVNKHRLRWNMKKNYKTGFDKYRISVTTPRWTANNLRLGGQAKIPGHCLKTINPKPNVGHIPSSYVSTLILICAAFQWQP